MRFTCELEIVYSLAVINGSTSSKSSRTRASLSLGKKPVSKAIGSSVKEELYLVVSTAKNVSGTKYKVNNWLIFLLLHVCTEEKLHSELSFIRPGHRVPPYSLIPRPSKGVWNAWSL